MPAAESARLLSGWESFYVIVGSSGGALIGLQFVVMTLIADRQTQARSDAVAAFGTPTVVHLTNALVVSAVMSAPWRSFLPLSMALGACGAAGLVYAAIAIRRARRQTDYEPVLEDWFWYAALPCVAYAVLALSAVFLGGRPEGDLFIVAAAALALLLIGIHNAWDSVTHIVITASAARQPPGDEQ